MKIKENSDFIDFGNNFKKIDEKNSLKNFILNSKTQTMNILQNNFVSPEDFAKQQIEKQNLEKMRQEKAKILKNETGLSIEQIRNRPTIETIDIDNENSIFKFSALQNLACAFSCCGDTTFPDRIQEITDIYNQKIPENKSVHFVIYYDPDWEKIKTEDPEEALEYFQVYIRENEQNPEKKSENMKQFKELYQIVKSKNDNK